MKAPRQSFLIVAVGLVIASALAAAAADPSPEDVLKRYLSALQSQRFEEAYDLVSAAMKTDRKTKQVKPKDVWVREAHVLFDFSETKILDFKVGKAELAGEQALVPNLLSSQDKFLNQLGVDEFELYTLVRENGGWKVDSQQEVIERSEIAKWFPGKAQKP